MKTALIVYESKYGNTKLVAEGIAAGMKRVTGIEVVLSDLTSIDMGRLAAFDALIIGSPNHMGSALKSITGFIDHLSELDSGGQKTAVFDTYMGGDFEKAVRKMEAQISQKAPGMKVILPGLSIKVAGTKGPVATAELPKSEEFGASIAALLVRE